MLLVKFGVLLLVGVVLGHGKAKEFRVEILELSSPSDDFFSANFEWKQINKTSISISGEYNLKQDLDDSYTIEVIVSLSGQTVEDPFIEVLRLDPEPICKMAGSAEVANNLIDFAQMCPVPAIQGVIDNEVVDFHPFLAGGFKGRFRFDVVIAKDNVEKLKATFVFAIK